MRQLKTITLLAAGGGAADPGAAKSAAPSANAMLRRWTGFFRADTGLVWHIADAPLVRC